MKYLIVLLSTLMLTGCIGTKSTIITDPVIVERPKYEVADPDPAKQLPFTWTVITKENFNQIVKDLEKHKQSVVFFALTPEGYENLAISVADLRRYINEQKLIIAAMKKYYESPVGTDTSEAKDKKDKK